MSVSAQDRPIYFAEWRDDGTTETIHELLRCQVREQAGRLDRSYARPARQEVIVQRS
jgi:hypothetical protein